MAVAHRIYTSDDLADTPDDLNRYEIIGGELFAWPAPPLAHQEVLGALCVGLRLFADANRRGKIYCGLVDVRLSPHNVVQPDIIFIAQSRLGILRQAYVDGAPDLVVEVISDRTRRVDLVRKRALYAMAGVPEYWLVDVDQRSVTVLTLVDGEYQVVTQDADVTRSSVVPGFAIAAADVFAGV